MAQASQVPEPTNPKQRLQEYITLARELSRAKTPEELVEHYRRHIRSVVQASRIVRLTCRGVPADTVRVTHRMQWDARGQRWIDEPTDHVLREGLLWRLCVAGEPVMLDQITLDANDPSRPYLDEMRSLVASPIFDAGEPADAVIMLCEQPAAFTLRDLCTLVLTSNLFGRAASQALLREELEQAYAVLDREFLAVGEIQRQLLPKELPGIPGVTFATYYEPSARAGGDYYTFWDLPDDQLALLIADVSGHGASAAVVVAMLHALLQTPRHACPRVSSSPAEVLCYLNEELSQTVVGGQFVTAFLGVLHKPSRKLRYANAGHNPPRLLRAGCRAPVSLKEEAGLPLAILPEQTYVEHVMQFSAGDRLLLYTDGITETFNARREMFGMEGIDAALDCCSRTADQLVRTIVTRVSEFAGGRPPADDRTIIAIAFD